jgi:hypothetical protein
MHSARSNKSSSEGDTGVFFIFLSIQYFIQHCFICRLSGSTVLDDAGIKLRTVVTSALAVRRSNYLAKSHHPIQLRHTPQH